VKPHARPIGGTGARSCPRAFLLPAVLLALVVLFSCVDTSSIARFAALSKVASDKFPEIAADYRASCMRTARYQAMDTAQYQVDKIEAAAVQTCNKSLGLNALEKDLIAANRTLMSYLDALGRLASNRKTVFDNNINSFAANMKATGEFDDAKIDAVKGLATFLSDAAAAGWRKKELARAIEAANPAVQTVAAALKTIVGEDYLGLLDNEEAAMRIYYGGTISAAQAYYDTLIARQYRLNPDRQPKELPEETVIMGYLHDKWQSDKTAVETKRAAARAYVTILEKIARGHQKLYDNRNKLDAKEIKDMILGYAQELDPLIQDLRKAF
jgi:hypothetical protein